VKKITFLYTHPIQYFAPLSKKIAEATFCNNLVLYCEDTTGGYFDTEFGKKINWDIPLLEGYPSTFLPNSKLSRLGSFFRLSNLAVRKYITKRQTDVLVVHGWSYFTALFAIFWAKTHGVKVWLRAESPYSQEIQKSWYNRWLKKLFLQFLLFKCIDKFLYIGEQNRQFYKYYGVKDKKFIFCPYCVDNERLQQSNDSHTSKIDAKAALGLSGYKFAVLFSGKLIDKKNPMDLVVAFYKAAIPDSVLVILGDGELMNSVKKFIEDHAIKNIVLAGFRNQLELPLYFKSADVFVLPSGMGETWGLVVNEAMNYELPLIVSDLTGSSTDLLHEGENGYVFPVGNVGQLAALLKRAAGDKEWLNSAGRKSREIVENYSYNTVIKNLRIALENESVVGRQ
jgi:glycosyltransferase involved in cell wall biosynthesis